VGRGAGLGRADPAGGGDDRGGEEKNVKRRGKHITHTECEKQPKCARTLFSAAPPPPFPPTLRTHSTRGWRSLTPRAGT
jgi:hypothetical protein